MTLYYLIAGLVLLMIFMFYEAHMNRLVKLDLAVQNLSSDFEGVTIFFISDIHRREISEQWLSSFSRNPDYIVIGGDLTEKGVPWARVRENVRRLKKLGPVLFVWGNHDWEAGHNQVASILNDMQVTVLDNETCVIDRNGYSINFSGVNDTSKNHDDLMRTLGSRKVGVPTLLFSHNPNIKHQLARSMCVDFVISGHTHSGQISLFGYRLKEKAGVKRYSFGTLIISSGFGTTKLPLRFGAKPDALMLTLRKG
ncbi:metallophosphoesterase [Sporolactobacillus kofuensis]|uniref:Metallophosphoesterase n=1 Tax=Sporolactobacillus kofuensis TaxID=269672 RepID=A0ABW1WEY8_9BACL|nr:metallophosphoesterase [Sporolactobacillus kofuensis]MCO7176618.1 metallophosphoesterase family protein [Sporolactobacillus kofuensis]